MVKRLQDRDLIALPDPARRAGGLQGVVHEDISFLWGKQWNPIRSQRNPFQPGNEFTGIFRPPAGARRDR
jgi:hypothetical protein